ncbi:MAG: hypothetical protein U0353_30855 [Sandaracinus sp.]
MTRAIIESVPLVVSITPIIHEARREGPGRVSGFVEPHAGRGAIWVSFEAVLDAEEGDGVIRIDARLRSGVLVSALVEAFAERVAGRADRLRWKVGCPGCGHAVRHLYVASHAEPVWGCRGCLHLVYESTRLRAPERALLMIRRRRAQLGQPGPAFAPLTRPHGMRTETFERHGEFVRRHLDRYRAAAPERAARIARLAAKVAKLHRAMPLPLDRAEQPYIAVPPSADLEVPRTVARR